MRFMDIVCLLSLIKDLLHKRNVQVRGGYSLDGGRQEDICHLIRVATVGHLTTMK